MKRSKRVITAALALLMLLLAGCGSAGGTAPAEQTEGEFVPALDTETACEIRVVGHYSNFEALEAEFDRFAAYYPHVELSYTYLDDYNNTIGPALSSEDAPNIYALFTWMLDKPDYDPLFEAAEDLADSALEMDLACIRPDLVYRDSQGRVPMVPVFSTTYGMLVNEDLFAKEGLDIPASYSALCSACETLQQRGYASPVMGYNSGANLYNPLVYPYFCASIQGDSGLIARLNDLDPSAGEALRPALELAEDFFSRGYADLEACSAFPDAYQSVILRFFEGAVPMMFVTGDVVSGTAKRESLSEAFTSNPFAYSFHPVPSTEAGGYFQNISSLEFAVNKNCRDLDMTNEFMRFLISTPELSNMAKIKRLVTVTTDLSLDGVYSSFGEVPADHMIYVDEMGLLDAPYVQLRSAAYQICNGNMTVDEAVAAFGSLSE